MRALIQSIVLPARSSSSSRHPSSISAKSEKRRAKEVRGTGINDVVLVVTNAYELAEVTLWKEVLTLRERRKRLENLR